MDTALFLLCQLIVYLFCAYRVEGDCVFFGKQYRHNKTITQSHLEHYHGYCFGYVCINSKIEFRDSFKCETVKGNQPHPIGCMVGNQYYRPQETVQIGVDDNNCKFLKVCMEGGAIVTVKDPTCNSTTTDIRTPEETTTPQEITTIPETTTTEGVTTPQETTTPIHCLYNGQYYPPGTVIEEGQDGSWCYSTICDTDGNVIHGDDFNCDKTTQQTTTPTDTTTTPETTSTPLRLYRQYNGQNYPPGTVIEQSQCSSTICDPDGNVLVADNFDCNTTTGQTTTPTDTTSTTTTENTCTPLQQYCQYNGQYYPPGTVIEKSQCSSTICDTDGNVLVADNFDCDTITRQTTSPNPADTSTTR